MSAANYLVRWMPDIVEATADDIARFGPNAAQVRGLLNYLPTMSNDALQLSSEVSRAANAAGRSGWDRANSAAWDADRKDAFNVARREAWGAARHAGRSKDLQAADDAAMGEVVSDLITPEQYHILTSPLNVVRTLQERMGLMLPDLQGPFVRMVTQLRPVLPEDILAVERLSGSPNVDALLEMLRGMSEGQPLARRIKAAETMYRAGRGGKGMS